MHMVHLEGLEEPQDLDVLPLARLAHPRFQQAAQGGERIGQVPSLQRRRLIEGADLLFQQGKEVHRIEDHVGLLVGPSVPRDHLGAAADDDLVHIAANLDLVMGKGDRHRIVIATIAHHGDRGDPGADLLAGVIGCCRQDHQRIEIMQQPFADRLAVTPQDRVLALEALFLQPGVQRIKALEARHRHQEVPPAKADHPLDVTLVIALAWPTEPVLEQVMRLQLGEGPGALSGPVPENPRHRNRRVVIQHRQRDAAEEREGRNMPVVRHASVVSAGYALRKKASECGKAIAK
jgi:hypothetical protein